MRETKNERESRREIAGRQRQTAQREGNVVRREKIYRNSGGELFELTPWGLRGSCYTARDSISSPSFVYSLSGNLHQNEKEKPI